MILSGLRRYSVNPKNFTQNIPVFIWDWLRYRSLPKLAAGTVPVVLSLWLVFLVWRANSPDYRAGLLSHYDALATQALENNRIEQSDLFFARTVILSPDAKHRSVDIAEVLYNRGDRQRSMAILQSLAPLRQRGYDRAHRLLSEHWQRQSPQTDVTRAIAMFHEMHAAGLEEGPRLRLAQFLSDRGHQEHALKCLTTLLHPSAEARLQLVQIYSRAGRHGASIREARSAEKLLRQQLADNDRSDTRILLSKAIACQHRVLDAIFVLAEACERQVPPDLADELIKCYVVWLSQMSPERIQSQIHEVALALENDPAEEFEVTQLVLKGGRTIELPTPITRLHEHLMLGEGNWLIPLLQGTELASEGKYIEAATRLEQALTLRPDNASIANNLAWTLLQLNITATKNSESPSDAAAADLRRAWDLANIAVNGRPDEPVFRETRGQLAGWLGNWDEALQDLNQCVAAGHNSQAIQATLARARLVQ